MNIAKLMRFLTAHMNVRERVALCRRLGMTKPKTGDEVSAELRTWLRVAPEAQFRELLSKVHYVSLLAWSREFDVSIRRKEAAIETLLLFAGTTGSATVPMKDDSEDGVGHNQAEALEAFAYDPQRALQPTRPYQKRCLEALERATRGGGPGKHLIHIATGGGKTRVANDWVWSRVLERKRVLWVTKDWELLRQAAHDLCSRHKGACEKVARVGGGGHLPQLKEKPSAPVVYTTIHTWMARADDEFRGQRFDYVVIDELHWGEGGASYGKLLKRYGGKIFVGLTATPRKWTSFTRSGEAYDFPYLVREEYLARPLVQAPRKTGVRWQPERTGADGDFTSASLTKLAKNAVRNQLIVDTYIKDRAQFGKTLIFVCNINHANRLALLFQKQGLSAEAIHSQMGQEDRRLVRERFRNNNTQVLINVAMLTHGVDIPDIQTIFLARPTASPTLFWQMVGRGSRRAPGKISFFVLDFVDVVKKYSDVTLSAIRELGDQFPTMLSHVTRERGQRLNQWEFSPAKILRYPGRPGYEDLTGLEFQPEQTFGIEFELTRKGFSPGQMPDDWKAVADELLKALRVALGDTYVAKSPVKEYHGEKSVEVWNVEWDSSCGWEVTTRILKGQEGLEEVKDACNAILEISASRGLRVDFRTGTHIHLGWKPTVANLHRLVGTAAYYEPALLSLVSPSRAQSSYCRPVRELLPRTEGLHRLEDWSKALADPSDRYYALNLLNLFDDYGTVEIRLHNGTQEAKKILTWLSLWMRMLEAVERGVVPATDGRLGVDVLPLCQGPQGDVGKLAALVGASGELTQYLTDRRAFVFEHSWLQHSDYAELAKEVSDSWV